MIKSSDVLFSEDLKKINYYVSNYPMGSYQMGEIARLSALLYERGVDVKKHLEFLCKHYRVYKWL